jgi:hypothetical protein
MADTGITVRYDEGTYAALTAEAARRKVSVAEVVRHAVQQHLAAEAAPALMPEVATILESTLERVFGRHINRLAALSSRAVIEAAWVKWLAVAIIERSADRAKGTVPMYDDVDGLLEETHQAAVRDCQRRAHPWDTKPATEAAPDEAPAPDAP